MAWTDDQSQQDASDTSWTGQKDQLNFLGYSFRYESGHTDRTKMFLTVAPSAKAVARRKAALRELTDHRHCFVPITELVTSVNHQFRGWGNYFSFGFTRRAHRVVNTYAVDRLTIHLHRRSQRGCRLPADVTAYTFLTRRLGLRLL